MLKIPLSQTIRVPINYYCYNTNKMPNNFEINFFVSYVRSKKSQQELCTLIKKFIATGSICNVVFSRICIQYLYMHSAFIVCDKITEIFLSLWMLVSTNWFSCFAFINSFVVWTASLQRLNWICNTRWLFQKHMVNK